MFTAVAYSKLEGLDYGVPFGPQFHSRAQVWRWLNGMLKWPCTPPPHDYIKVEPVDQASGLAVS